MKHWRNIKDKRTIKFFFIIYFIILYLATFFLRTYNFDTNEYIETILYVRSNLLLTDLTFTAMLISLKLTAFLILGNIMVRSFTIENIEQIIRYGIDRYYIMEVAKITGMIFITTFGTIIFWSIISSSWISSILKILFYIILMSGITLSVVLMNFYLHHRFINILYTILVGCAFLLFRLMKDEVIYLISIILYGIVNFLLIQYIRSMDYM